MKKSVKAIIAIGVLVSGSTFFNQTFSDSNGAPANRAGGISDAGGCNASGCHTGLALKQETDWITSDIDTAGYEPGKTYIITAKMTNNKSGISGFEISPQGASSKALGTVALISTAKTLVRTGTASRKYVTHTTSGNKDTTWSFKWTAPVMGSGTVTFFGMFNEANGNGNSAGDQIHASKLLVKEKAVATGLTELAASTEKSMLVYPVPASGMVNLLLKQQTTDQVAVSLFNTGGQLVRTSGVAVNADHVINLDINGLDAGVYLVTIKSGNTLLHDKIVIE